MSDPTEPREDAEPNYTAMKPVEMVQALGDDAHKWATAFRQCHPSAMNHDLMVTWFANCIERSHEVRIARMTPPTTVQEESKED